MHMVLRNATNHSFTSLPSHFRVLPSMQHAISKYKHTMTAQMANLLTRTFRLKAKLRLLLLWKLTRDVFVRFFVAEWSFGNTGRAVESNVFLHKTGDPVALSRASRRVTRGHLIYLIASAASQALRILQPRNCSRSRSTDTASNDALAACDAPYAACASSAQKLQFCSRV